MSFLPTSEVDAGPDDLRTRPAAASCSGCCSGSSVVFGGLYVAAHYAAGDKVPRGTTVSGVSIGGHPQAEAADRLQAGLAEQVSAPVEATVDGTPVTRRAHRGGPRGRLRGVRRRGRRRGELGPGPALELLHRRRRPRGRGHRRRGRPRAPWSPASTPSTAAPRARAPWPSRGPGSPRRSRGPVARSTRPRPATRSCGAWLDGETAELELVEQQPEIDAGDLAEARESFANAAVSGPGHPDLRASTVRLQPADYTPALSMEPVDGTLVPRLDARPSPTMLENEVAVDGAPVDATVALVGGRPQVVPAKPGVTYDQKQITDAFLALVAASGDQRTPGGRRQGRAPGLHHQGRARAPDQGAGLELHDLLPLRRVPQRQHRPGRRARRRHAARAGRDVQPQRHGRRADPRERLHRGLRHLRRHPGQPTSAAASRRWRPRPSTRCSSPASRTSSTSRTRSTSTATRSAARPPSRGARSTCASATTRRTAS